MFRMLFRDFGFSYFTIFMKATIMSSDDYQVQNIYRYNRKTYKKNVRRNSQPNDKMQDEINIENGERSPRYDDIRIDGGGCSCDMDPEGDVANILHKKCPVITLAQQQLQRLLDKTDKIICDDTRCCRSIYDFICICKEVLMTQNKCLCVLFMLLAIAFALGVFFGAATCGTYLGKFNNPILTCLDNLFISDKMYTNLQEFRGIV